MDTAEVLERAADIIEFERGWCQGAWGDAEGRVCVVGALTVLRRQALNKFDTWPAILAMRQYVGQSVVSFNDAPDRTMEEVLDALRGCAKALREVQS